jgi:quaternary ammonium compound-resistance protein SugE
VSWLLLLIAGLFEIVWAVALKQTHGFTRFTASFVTVSAMIASLYFLSLALRTLPLGTAYIVWVGIGAVGTAIAGFAWFGEAVTPLKVISLVLVVAGVLGLKLASTA